MPLVAILRGITPDEALEASACLRTAGIRIVEVPLNSPDALKSIELIAQRYGDQMLVGAGTVLSAEDVKAVYDAGGQLIVSPNTDVGVIKTARELNMVCLPGAATPTEVFNAHAAGACGVKAYPAEMITPAVIKSWQAVLPKNFVVLPVGGVALENMDSYWTVGAGGFGIGGGIYQPGKSIEDIQSSATAYVEKMNALISG